MGEPAPIAMPGRARADAGRAAATADRDGRGATLGAPETRDPEAAARPSRAEGDEATPAHKMGKIVVRPGRAERSVVALAQ